VTFLFTDSANNELPSLYGVERERDNERMDIIKTFTGLPVEDSVRMTEDRDKWRK